MPAEQNKQLIRRLFEERVNQGDDEVIEAIVSPQYRLSGDESEQAEGVAGFKALAAAFRTAFPDGCFDFDHVIAEGDKVVTWGTFTGTHLGPMGDLPPTGKSVRVKAVDLYRLEDGRLVESWSHFDQAGMMRQLGVVPG